MQKINVLSSSQLNKNETKTKSKIDSEDIDFSVFYKTAKTVSGEKEQRPEVIDKSNKEDLSEMEDLLQYLQGYLFAGKDAELNNLPEELTTNTSDYSTGKTILSGMIPSQLLGDMNLKGMTFNKNIKELLINLFSKEAVVEQGSDSQSGSKLDKKQGQIIELLSDLNLTINKNKSEIIQLLEKLSGTLSEVAPDNKAQLAAKDKEAFKGEIVAKDVNTNNIEQGNNAQSLAKDKVTFEREIAPQQVNKRGINLVKNNLPDVNATANTNSEDTSDIKNASTINTGNQLQVDNIRINTINFSLDKVDWQPLQKQIIDFLQNKLVDKKEIRTFEIQLHPAELGKIQIAVHWQDGQVHLNLLATEASTHASLHQNLPDLRQKLEQMGVVCGSMQAGLSDNRPNGQQESKQQKNRYNIIALEDDSSESINMQTYQTATQNNLHRINVTA